MGWYQRRVHGVAFSYSGEKKDYLYHKLELGVDLDSRIALVGPNGAGKSTLLKLMLRRFNLAKAISSEMESCALGNTISTVKRS